MSRIFAPLAILVVSLFPATAAAHDYWIQPADFTIATGQKVPLRLFVGTKGDITEHPYNKRFTIRFEAFGPEGKRVVAGANHYRPAGSLLSTKEGIYTVVFQSNHSFIELDAAKFKSYLITEGLDAIVRERQKSGESNKPGKESYARYCKALVRAGTGNDGFDRVVGLPLELTAKSNPFVSRAGGKLAFVLTENGKPLVKAQVELMSLADASIKTKAFTDKRGRVTFKIPAAGKWMVAATTMRRAPAGIKGDWESSWATLSFEVPAK